MNRPSLRIYTTATMHLFLSSCAILAGSSVVLASSPQGAGRLPLDPTLVACRRDPMWKSVDYIECQRLMRWTPRDKWWRQDSYEASQWLEGKDSGIQKCLQDAFEQAEKEKKWPT